MKKRFLKALTIWGGIDFAICTGILLYSAVKASQIDRENHGWVTKFNTPAPNPFADEYPSVDMPVPGIEHVFRLKES